MRKQGIKAPPHKVFFLGFDAAEAGRLAAIDTQRLVKPGAMLDQMGETVRKFKIIKKIV